MHDNQGNNNINKYVENLANKSTRWIGSTQSLIFHTTLFSLFFLLIIFGVNELGCHYHPATGGKKMVKPS